MNHVLHFQRIKLQRTAANNVGFHDGSPLLLHGVVCAAFTVLLQHLLHLERVETEGVAADDLLLRIAAVVAQNIYAVVLVNVALCVAGIVVRATCAGGGTAHILPVVVGVRVGPVGLVQRRPRGVQLAALFRDLALIRVTCTGVPQPCLVFTDLLLLLLLLLLLFLPLLSASTTTRVALVFFF